ncbi:Uncharacterized protein TCM_031617 [Theobroma cacao]|uniref:MORF/ORRM1/DAG-like MORF domain-containing protein n=1 Tax=Theobroma cacao TaxID=3641 RepID=A0A061F6V4_THECC|nr:Uncharacterized protein TCM_031617 [Theobroma cacao]
MKIYSVSTRHYYAFGGLVSEENLKGVRWVYPDSYLDVKNKLTYKVGSSKILAVLLDFVPRAIQKHVSPALQSTGRILAPNDDLVSNLRCISPNDDPLVDLSLEIAKADSLLQALKNFTAAEL